MEKIKKFLKSNIFEEVFRFCITGGVSFLIDYGILFVLTEFAGLNYLISSGISFTVSVVVNYIMCVKWVFDAKDMDSKSVIAFVGSSVIGLGLNQIFMWVFVEKFGMFYMVAKIITTILVMFWNYVAKRKAVVK